MRIEFEVAGEAEGLKPNTREVMDLTRAYQERLRWAAHKAMLKAYGEAGWAKDRSYALSIFVNTRHLHRRKRPLRRDNVLRAVIGALDAFNDKPPLLWARKEQITATVCEIFYDDRPRTEVVVEVIR
jgi:hypothetical protein